MYFRNSVFVPVHITPEATGSSGHKVVQRDILYGDSDNILFSSGRFLFPIRILSLKEFGFAEIEIVNKGCWLTGLGTESPA